LRLLPASDREKNTEILVLRHQIAVLERHLGGRRVRFTAADRALLAALLHRLKPAVLCRMRLLVRPDTVLRWHRDLIRGRHPARSNPSGLVGRRRRVPSGCWCCVWCGRIPGGGIGACTANCSCSE
jgi:hypothetical protein